MTRYAPVEPLTAEHDRSTFECGSVAQSEWLRQYGLLAQQADTARVYVIRPHGERRVAGYYALSAGAVVGRHPIPVILLSRLGVDGRDQHRGLGTELVRDAFLQTASIADRVGARALLVHAETADAARFYRRLDPAFEPGSTDPLHLVLLLKDLRRAVTKAVSDAEDDFFERQPAEVQT